MTLLLPATFLLLLLITLATSWRAVMSRQGEEWAADLSGLVMQGVVIPLLQTFGLTLVLQMLIPAAQGRLSVGMAGGFLLNFIVVDYLYYWNHRLMHGALWPWHAVHHSARTLDVLVTSRNTLLTPLLIVYVWVNALLLVLVDDPRGYLASIALTAALDVWRHSSVHLPSALNRYASLLLITTRHHAWHHSSDRTDSNFGANLSLWDRLHGTYCGDPAAPASLGVEPRGGIARNLLLPSTGAGKPS